MAWGQCSVSGSCEKIFLAKGRPVDNPLIVHIAYFWQGLLLVREIPEKGRVLARRFWPGPLTLVMPKSRAVPDAVTAGLDTVAVRMPDHPVARELIRLSGCTVAAPSANISGKPSPTTARHVLRDLYGKIDGVLDGGSCEVGVESTVVDVTSKVPVLLRPGGISREQLEEAVGNILVDANMQELNGDSPPRSPGMKYTHYAPSGKVFLVEGEPVKAAAWICRECISNREKGRRTAVLCSRETAHYYNGVLALTGLWKFWEQVRLESVARNLYAP